MQDLGVPEAIRACAEIGYHNVELALLPGSPTAVDRLTPTMHREIRHALAGTSMSVSSLLLSFSLIGDEARHERTLEDIRLAAAVGREFDQHYRPVLESTAGGRPRDGRQHYDTMVRRVRAWDQLASEEKITIALKAHVSTAVNTATQLLALLQDADARHVAVAFDYSHYQLAGLGLEKSFPPLASRTRFIHVKDAVGGKDDFRFLPPGEGETDYGKLFRLMRRYGYQGPIVVEISRQIFSQAGYDPIATARRCFARLSPFLSDS
jgi:inosose dehydratase